MTGVCQNNGVELKHKVKKEVKHENKDLLQNSS